MPTLRPATEIVLTHAGNSVVLRASLRAAVAIDHLDGGIPAVLERLTQGYLSTIRAVIRAAATDRQQAERFLSSLDGHPLRPFMDEATPACLATVAAVLPSPEDDQAKPSSTTCTETTGKPWADHFADLYRYATGWLSWTPEAAWNASADEITTAFAARVDHLIAVNGGKRDDDQDDDQAGPVDVYTPEKMREIEELGRDPAFQRDKLRALKARMG